MNIISKKQKKLNSYFSKKVLSFFILSSIFVSANCLFATYFSYLLFETEPNFKLLFAVFCITFTVYNLNKLTDKKEDLVNLPERMSYIQDEELLIFVMLISWFMAILLSFSVNFLIIPLILFPFIAGILYSIQIHPKIPRFKDITGLKSFIVAISWVAVVSFIPSIYLQNVNIKITLISYLIFIKLFVNAVVFDIRDIEGDRENNIKTIPVVMGLSKTKKLLFAIHSTLIPWLAVSLYLGFFTRYLPVLIFCIIYGYWYIHYFCTTQKIPKFATDILVDGEWILIAALCFIITII